MRNAPSYREATERTVPVGPWAYLSDRETVIVRLRDTQRVLTDTDFIDEDIRTLEEELTAVTEMLRLCIEENAANATTEETYRATHAELCRRFEETEARLTSLQKQRDRMKGRCHCHRRYDVRVGRTDRPAADLRRKALERQPSTTSSSMPTKGFVFCFKDGKEIVTGL